MASFMSDEVRGAFVADATGVLGTIEDTVREVLSLHALDAEATRGAPFERLADDLHALYGSAALVKADSMAGTAFDLEALAREGAAALVEAERLAARVREIAELCVDGTLALRTMFDHEMSGRTDQAARTAAEIRTRIPSAPGRPAPMATSTVSVASGDEELEFGDASAEPPAVPAELMEAFREDVATLIPDIASLLVALRRPSPPAHLYERGERIFHAIKGAAATVGLDVVSGLALALQDRFESAAADGKLVLAHLDEVVRMARRLVERCGFEPTVLPAPTAAAEAHSARRAFLLECQDGLARAREVTGDREPSDEACATLHELFGGLRASAMLITELAFVGELAQIEGACAAGPDAAGWSLADGLPRLEGMVELGLAETGTAPDDDLDAAEFSMASMPVAARDGSLGAELEAAFQQEIAAEVQRLAPLIQAYERAPNDRRVAEQLERIFHTLKGAAATVGLADAAAAANEMQHALEDVLAGGAQAPSLGSQMVAVVQRLVRAAGMPPVSIAPPTTAATATGAPTLTADVRRAFSDEVRDACAELGGLMTRIGRTDDAAVRARAEAIAILHRLKGSALLVGSSAIAEDAVRLRAILESDAGGVPLVAALSQGVAGIGRSAGVHVAGPSPGRREPVVIADDPRLWDAFLQECSELLEQLDRLAIRLESGSDAELVESLMRAYHTLKGALNTIGLGPSGRCLHRLEDYLEELRERGVSSPSALSVELLEIQGEIRKNLEQASSGWVDIGRLSQRIDLVVGTVDTPSPVDDVVSHSWRFDDSRASVRTAPSAQSAQSARSVPSVPSPSKSTGTSGTPGTAERSAGLSALERRTLRVSTDRLDSLMSLAGELVVARSRLVARVAGLRSLRGEMERTRRRMLDTVDQFREQHEFTMLGRSARGVQHRAEAALNDFEFDRYDDFNVLARALAEVADDSNEVNGLLARALVGVVEDSDGVSSLVSGIQTEVTRARMVPLSTLFTRLRLPIRDAAEREGKQVKVATRGDDVEIDKSLLDSLFTPMLHLVRNAVSHGIEDVHARAARGKDAEGTITLLARQESGQIVIEVRDDGGGLDLAALHARGVADRLIRPEVPIDDPAVRDLVFAPGLSTREVAADVAGRGVGGDAARRAVQRMNGDLRVDSMTGQGAVFTITLPVTLAITRAVLVQHGGRRYAVPLHFADRVLLAGEAVINESGGRRRLRLGSQFIPLHRLDDLLGESRDTTGATPRIVIVRVGDNITAVEVDEVIGQEEIVVRDLGALLAGHHAFTGMATRGAGELVLILDVPGLLGGEATKVVPPTVTAESAAAAETKPEVLAPAAPSMPSPSPSPSSKRLRVLWVDDSLSVRRVAEKTLAEFDVEVVTAIDGVDALSRLRDETFDLVFTDLEMPRMNGYDLIREIRYLPHSKALPVVVVSSRSSAKYRKLASDAGGNAFIAKPFTTETVREQLARWCGERVMVPPPRVTP